MEPFEQIRQEYEHGVGTIRTVAVKLEAHWRLVRQALAAALPLERKRPQREQPKFGPIKEFIDTILQSDRKAPRKQSHTAHRIYIGIPLVGIGEAPLKRSASKAWSPDGTGDQYEQQSIVSINQLTLVGVEP